MLNFKQGHRVQVVAHHPWMANRHGVIKRIHNIIGNRFLIKFDHDELGTWHDEDGDPVLFLGEKDLILSEDATGLAA
jgi:hypothetical protein